LKCLSIIVIIGAICRLKRKITHTLQDVGGLLQCTFSGLRNGDTIICVANCYTQTVNLAGHTIGNLQARGVILGTVDAAACG